MCVRGACVEYEVGNGRGVARMILQILWDS